jgi:hypothetical protein
MISLTRPVLVTEKCIFVLKTLLWLTGGQKIFAMVNVGTDGLFTLDINFGKNN